MKKAIDFDGDFSGDYDDIAKEIITGYHTMYDLARHLLEDALSPRARVLVAGAGTGKETVSCSRRNPGWSLVGFDPAGPMLEVAKKKVLASNLEGRISFVHGTVDDVEESDFDAATSILVMHFLPDDGSKLEFLEGISSRMKPGGKLVLVDLTGDRASDEYETLNAAWKRQQLSTRNDDVRVEKEFAARATDVMPVSSRRLRSLLTEAGFVDVYEFFRAYLFVGFVATRR